MDPLTSATLLQIHVKPPGAAAEIILDATIFETWSLKAELAYGQNNATGKWKGDAYGEWSGGTRRKIGDTVEWMVVAKY